MSQLAPLIKAIAACHPPNWQQPLKAYSNFDWGKIGAKALEHDRHGATKVLWAGHIYLRRAGENKKYGAALWFSRPNGKGEGDEATYVRLISFKDKTALDSDVEPIPEYVARLLPSTKPQTQPCS
jgi:DdrB-like protein